MMTPPHLTSPLLEGPGLVHGFFSRIGGVSEGVFASLNVGAGSSDAPESVFENRKRCANAIGLGADRLVTNYQIHSNVVVTVDGPPKGEPAKADALVAKTPNLALGVLAADCMPWLFADMEAGVIGAAHAGWRGALAGVLENTIAQMERLGATPSNIRAALGPCLRQHNFEVGLELQSAFVEKYPNAGQFFAPGASGDKRQLNLAGFAAWRLRQAGLVHMDDVEICTLDAPERYFSYRAAQRRNEDDYGRNLSVVALRGQKG